MPDIYLPLFDARLRESQCGVFRAFQGWTSMSDTGPNEGTLRVYPLIKELTAYTMMRPLFRYV